MTGNMKDQNVPGRPVIVFDVNETLLNLDALRPTFDRIFNDPAAMRLWFADLILYSEALTLAGVYVPFTDIGGAVLRMLAATRDITITDADAAELTDRFATMPPHPEVPARPAPAPRAWLPAVHADRQHAGDLRAAAGAGGRDRRVRAPFQRQRDVRRHKPAPEAYHSVAAALEVDPGDICLIASHVWDTIGAVRPAGRPRSSFARATPRSTSARSRTTSGRTSMRSPISSSSGTPLWRTSADQGIDRGSAFHDGVGPGL